MPEERIGAKLRQKVLFNTEYGVLHPTVLIVDDDPRFRADLASVLRVAGYDAMESRDGRDALAALEHRDARIDLLIVDLCLPDDVSGLDVIARARALKIPIKIIATSAVFEQVYLDIATHLGADIAFRKSVDGQVGAIWLDTVRGLLGEQAPPVPPLQQLVVLADDDSGARTFCRIVMQGAGYQVLEACDGGAALSLIEKIHGALDLLVTDYRMPVLNGVELVRAMRAKYPEVPVVYISGYANADDGESFNDAVHACTLVRKPFKAAQLLQAVRSMIRGSAIQTD